jgi:methyl-accepting chemotaxis protein
MTIKKKFLLQLIIISTVIAISSLIVIPKALASVKVWDNYVSHILARTNYVSELKSQAGYGGAIHNFKNLVLRGSEKYANKFYKNYDKINNIINQYKELDDITDQEAADLDEFLSVITQYKEMVPIILSKYNSATDIRELDKIVKINDTPAVNALQNLINYQTTLLQQSTSEIKQNITNIVVSIIITFIIFFLVVLVDIKVLEKSIFVRINSMTGIIKSISEGKFTITEHTEGKDELEQLQNILVDTVTSIGDKLSSTFDRLSELGTNTVNLLSQINQIRYATDTTIGETSQLASASQEMNATIEEIAENTKGSKEQMNKTIEIVEKGREILNQVNDLSNNTNSKINTLSDSFVELKNKSEKIGSVLDVINNLSDQTNLLAINAAVEAARAGESGKGFAVVANEVKTLAEKTQSSTKEIDAVISEIHNQIDRIVVEMDESKVLVKEQANHAIEVNENFETIIKQIEKTDKSLKEITDSIHEQSTTTNEIAQSSEVIYTDSKGLYEISNMILDVTSQLVKSVSTIEKEFQNFETNNLATLFIRGKIDHAIFLKNIMNFFITNKSDFDITDHFNCRFGKFYYDSEIQKKYNTNSDFRKLEPIHEEIHNLAKQTLDEGKKGNPESSAKYAKQMIIKVEEFIKIIDKIINDIK